MANTRRRVKLYTLNEERQWDDRGTGHVSSSFVERLQGMSIMVRSEEDGSILLESKIQPHTAYQKQQETLIVWSEGENYDLALSFQEKAGCDEIWEKICQVQGKDPSVTITQDIPEDEDCEERFEEVLDSAGPIELPPCELSKLDDICELFNSVLPSPVRREKLALAIEQDNYIKKLIDVFHMCEDLENMEALHQLHEILKSVFLMNKPSLLEILFSEDMLFEVVGCMEYDPSHPEPRRHREFLKESANFKEVIPITNQDIIAKIHQTYRVQYILDNILPVPNIFDENTLGSVNSFIFFNKIEIITHLQEDEHFLADLFLQLVDEETGGERRKLLVYFLKELVGFSVHLQLHQKDEFFKALSCHGLLQALEHLIISDNVEVTPPALEIFMQVVDISPYLVREFIMQGAKSHDDKEELLINHIIDYMICDGDTGTAYQLAQLIRILLDPENMALGANKMEKSEFLSFFYKHCMHVLTAPLFAATAENRLTRDNYTFCVTLGHIVELLTFCVEHHTYHIKNYVISKDLLKRVLILMASKHKFLVLSALRFLRRILGLKDEFYNRYIVKGKLFDAVISAFKENGHKYNLLDSAVVELFEFVRVEDIKSVCNHVMEEYRQFFQDLDYVSTFKGLLLRYEQEEDRKKTSRLQDRALPEGIIHSSSRFRRDARSLEEEEESWFNQDDDTGAENGEEAVVPQQELLENSTDTFKPRNAFSDGKQNNVADSSSGGGGQTAPSVTNKKATIGLVDYPDDDDEDDDGDEDYASPAKRPRVNAMS